MLVHFMMEEHGVSERQACKALRVPRSSYQYKSKAKNDIPVINELQEMVSKHPAIGFWQSYFRLRRKGFVWNHKKVYRVYTALHLNIRRRFKKRLPARIKQALFQPTAINEVWSIDFMSDSLWSGRKFRLLNIVDDFNRQMLAMEADISLPALRVIRVLEYLKEFRGLPKMIRVDNGPEFISLALEEWCRKHTISLTFIQPGKPMQNGYVERCNGSVRKELLNANVFYSLAEVRERVEEWMLDYNHHRPHESLNYQAPIDLLEAIH
jgi:putative transposase